jgi:hypothetical protein
VWIDADPFKVTTVVTTGVIQTTTAIDPTSLVTSWTTSFSTWDEYRVVGWTAQVNCFSSTNPGILSTWVEEKSSAAPTNAICKAARANRFSAGDVFKKHQKHFVVADPLDLQYTALGTSKIVGYYDLYTDNAVYGSSVVATDYAEIVIKLLVQFRGFA